MPATTLEARILISARDTSKAALNATRSNISNVGRAVTSVQSQVLALAGIGGFGAMITGIVRTNAHMQTLKSSLKTVTGGTEEARKAFATIEQFAVTTPFDLNDWTEAFIKLKAFGLDPSNAALKAYGNTASAMGKSLNQVIEAVADASSGEFERLRDFGIRANREGDKVKFTFQGVTTQVRNDSQSIVAYLQRIGNVNFAGSMDDQMQNLIPAFSNLKQSFASLAVSIGEAGLNDIVRDLAVSIKEMADSITPGQVQAVFNDIESAATSAYNTINGMPHLAEMGLIGYMLFGKRGLALAAGVSFLSGKLGNDIGRAWEEFNPSQVVAGSGGFTGQPGFNPMPDYQLGDFNRSNGRMGYLDVLRSIEQRKSDSTREMVQQQQLTNERLSQAVDAIRKQSNVAVFG